MKKNQTFEMKKIIRKNNGITLIALVITVIVLLILAGVTIATLTGENGILTRASEAEVETRGAAVEEEKNLWEANKIANKYATGDVETLAELLERIGPNGSKLLTQEEIDEINETGKTTIGSRTIEFGTDAITIGEIYDDSMIGQKVNYSSNGQSNWIIFGKDESGNVLLTTERPIPNEFELTVGPESWLTYKEDLKQACSGYGGEIKGRTIEARSITMEDINYVTGFEVEELKFDTYTFGTVQNYENQQVNFYYPSEEKEEDEVENDYWKRAETESEAQQFEDNWYMYGQMGEQLIYMYSGEPGGADATSLIKNADRLKYIIGADGSYEYLVASRSVSMKPGYAWFNVAGVTHGAVLTNDNYSLCRSNSDGGNDYGDGGLLGIRPIVVLPSDIEVEENASGQWDIAY